MSVSKEVGFNLGYYPEKILAIGISTIGGFLIGGWPGFLLSIYGANETVESRWENAKCRVVSQVTSDYTAKLKDLSYRATLLAQESFAYAGFFLMSIASLIYTNNSRKEACSNESMSCVFWKLSSCMCLVSAGITSYQCVKNYLKIDTLKTEHRSLTKQKDKRILEL